MRAKVMPTRCSTILAATLIAGLSSAAGASRQDAVQTFDGGRALAHAEAMVAMGPRALGSEALERNRVYIEEDLRALGLEAIRDAFIADTPLGPVEMANILADVPAAAGSADARILLLAGHFDTKLFEGVEFVGANDGASSAAILLELARVLVVHPPPLPVRLVFFDGEEAVVQWTDSDSTYGSRHLVSRWLDEGKLDEIGALVLFDMIGDADLRVPKEVNSTAWLTEVIWSAARQAGHGEQFPDDVQAILDDHLPFLAAGVDAVDLIDFNYGPGNRYWHAPFDTADKLGAGSFQIVGETVLTALPAIAARLRR